MAGETARRYFRSRTYGPGVPAPGLPSLRYCRYRLTAGVPGSKQYYTIVEHNRHFLYPFLRNSIDFFTSGDKEKNKTKPWTGSVKCC